MTDDTPLPFDLPAVRRKKLTVDFTGGNQSSNGGLLLLRQAERRLGVCRRLAAAIRDKRDPARVRHKKLEIIMARSSAIACGHMDANDHDRLRDDPLMKLAVEREPESGDALASQSTHSRFENAPRKVDAARLTGALVDQFGATIKPQAEEIVDIDDTFCAAHGGQQLAFWNAHNDERGFATMHINHVRSGTTICPILRPARTPKGTEVATVVKHVTRRLRRHWLASTRIIWRGDSHYGRDPVMTWCEDNGEGFIFGLPGNAVLDAMIAETCDHLRFWHAIGTEAKLRCYASHEYKARKWKRARRVIARIECSLQPDPKEPGLYRQEVDVRWIVTSLEGKPEHLYENVYCQRGQMENLIKLHKTQLASDRMSCHSATANQVRLVWHTAAFWLMHGVRAAIPAAHALATAEFRTIRDRLLKIAARVIEHAARIRVVLPTSCPDGALFRSLALGLMASGP